MSLSIESILDSFPFPAVKGQIMTFAGEYGVADEEDEEPTAFFDKKKQDIHLQLNAAPAHIGYDTIWYSNEGESENDYV